MPLPPAGDSGGVAVDADAGAAEASVSVGIVVGGGAGVGESADEAKSRPTPVPPADFATYMPLGRPRGDFSPSAAAVGGAGLLAPPPGTGGRGFVGASRSVSVTKASLSSGDAYVSEPLLLPPLLLRVAVSGEESEGVSAGDKE